MAYTLQNLLRSDILPEAQILAVPSDSGNIEIRYISIQELPFEEFLRENEIVITTGIGCISDPKLFYTMLDSISNSNAVGIIYAFEDVNYVIPGDVAEYAERLGIALIQIPWKYRFHDIQESVTSAIRNASISRYENLQRALFKLFFAGSDMQQAARRISAAFNCSVSITDSGKRTIESSQLSLLSNRTVSVTIKIQLNNSIVGCCNLFFDASCADLPSAELLEPYVAFPLSLWFSKKNIENLTTIKLKNDFVQNLATGKYDSYEEMVQWGDSMGFDLRRAYTCIMMKALILPDNPGFAEFSAESAKCASELTQLFIDKARNLNLHIMVSNMDLEFIIFYENQDAEALQPIRSFIRLLAEEIYERYPLLDCYWGISEISMQASVFAKWYESASHALKYCLESKPEDRIFSMEDTIKVQVISALSENPDLIKKADEVLHDIISYNMCSEISLFDTMTEYFRCNYNVSETARKLHIHRQSLLYRINKIETLTGMSLSNHDDLFVLEILSRVHSFY